MPTLQDYKTVRIQDSNIQKGLDKLNEEAQNGYFVIDTLADDNERGVTTFLLSQYQPVNNKRDPDANNAHINIQDNNATEDFILLDLSDTVNYPHSFTNFLDLEALQLYVDADSNATFSLRLGFLENVNSTDGQFFEIMRTESDNQAGVEQEIDAQYNGMGGQLRSQDWLSSNQPVTTEFANTVSLASTLDPTTANVNPDDGDLVVRISRDDTTMVSFYFTLVYKSN